MSGGVAPTVADKTSSDARAFTPSHMALSTLVNATDLKAWADTHDAQEILPRLVRRLAEQCGRWKTSLGVRITSHVQTLDVSRRRAPDEALELIFTAGANAPNIRDPRHREAER